MYSGAKNENIFKTCVVFHVSENLPWQQLQSQVSNFWMKEKIFVEKTDQKNW